MTTIQTNSISVHCEEHIAKRYTYVISIPRSKLEDFLSGGDTRAYLDSTIAVEDYAGEIIEKIMPRELVGAKPHITVRQVHSQGVRDWVVTIVLWHDIAKVSRADH